MPHRVLAVTAPSRLHFGLFAFGEGHQTQFGGVGLMIDRPKTRLRFAHSQKLSLQVTDEPRARRTIEKWFNLHADQLREPILDISKLGVAIRQVSGPASHVGLGAGTQVTLALVAGLDRWFRISPEMTIADAEHFGRARRSAVGSHGFFLGGLIIDQGKNDIAGVGILGERFELPSQWRVVLTCPRHRQGPCGQQEEELFHSLPPVKLDSANGLRQLVDEQLIPAARAADFDQFSETIYEFGYRAGLCFGSYQGGPYNGPDVSRIVDFVRSIGVKGVGQSSWGPTVFALCSSPADAELLSANLQKEFSPSDYWHEITPINNQGYSVSECTGEPITMEELS